MTRPSAVPARLPASSDGTHARKCPPALDTRPTPRTPSRARVHASAPTHKLFDLPTHVRAHAPTYVRTHPTQAPTHAHLRTFYRANSHLYACTPTRILHRRTLKPHPPTRLRTRLLLPSCGCNSHEIISSRRGIILFCVAKSGIQCDAVLNFVQVWFGGWSGDLSPQLLSTAEGTLTVGTAKACSVFRTHLPLSP